MNNINFNAPTPLIANGILGHAVTGLVRIPSFMATCMSAMMVGEFAIRGLRNFFEVFGLRPSENSFIQGAATHVTNYGVRPYQDIPAGKLAGRLVAFAAIGIVGSELARLLGGAPPAIYNNVLAFMGPVRIDPRSYLTGVQCTLSGLGIL
ncbi:MAG: hypothetical protein H0V82_04545 [Candidatus Protochlamydia sp.]|nr:hypothetical protein [Candidatus Protochlamydia sp.]